MSAIFGIFRRDQTPVSRHELEAMQTASAHWGRNGSSLWFSGCAGLGQARTFSTAESQYEQLPSLDPERNLAFTAAGRLDNREDLISELKTLRATPELTPDTDLIYHAYLKWGENCVNHLYGDWAFSVWNPVERKLFLARDHFGNTALYYYADAHLFAFASERRALLALNLPPMEMDELFLAQVLISWVGYHDGRTIYKQIQRLPPAHLISITPESLTPRQYWEMRDVSILRLPKKQDYVEAFREKFDAAVQARLRAPAAAAQSAALPVATTLSGGLDSGAVTATAAMLLRGSGKQLTAYTSVPMFDTTQYVDKRRFGDEWEFAHTTAQFAGNVEHHPIDAAMTTPMQAIHHALQIHDEPGHAAGNFFWMQALENTAHEQGHTALLTGQFGNASISWTGSITSQPLAYQIKQKGWRTWLREQVSGMVVPASILRARKKRRIFQEWGRHSAIHIDFAARLNLLEQQLNSRKASPPSALQQRFQILMPGETLIGMLHAQMGAAHGIEIRDPTGDARVVAYTLSVPDEIFIDPKTGLDRWLIRAAMQGRMPDETRLNQRRGRQAGDLVPRLRNSAPEVESALTDIENGPAREYLDVTRMREAWQVIQTQDDVQAFIYAGTTLTRGLMAGLWVNNFYKR